jgi:cytochrome c biogenesis protein CcdA
MRIRRLAIGLLRIAGILLIALGVIHLAATPHLPHLLDGMRSSENYRLALGPTLLNHVLVGFLLVPLGYSTWLRRQTPI